MVDSPAEPAQAAGTEEASEEIKEQAPHPIAVAIDRLVHRARDIKLAVRQFMPLAQEIRKIRLNEIIGILDKNAPLSDDPDPHTRVLAQKEIHAAVLRLHRWQNSQVPSVVENGLFLSLFSAFDAFTGELLRGLFERKPVLFRSINKPIPFGEVLDASSLEVLKLQVLDDEVETLRRKSYVEQFATLAQRFDVKLTIFEHWPAFVECSQRRNLITHCDGVVTEQYLTICREAGVASGTLPAAGSKVILGPDYFYPACELVIEVALKLGQTLWRKALPEELESADKHLMNALYEALESRIWPRSRIIGEYAFSLRNLVSDLNRKIITVNYAQALKRDGAADEAGKIMNDVDWTAAANDFKLANAVLLERYDEAAELMRKIGREGELLKEHGYHTWPLFIEFRETEQFARAYQEVFGHPYSDKLKEDASKASRDAAAEASKEPAHPSTTVGSDESSASTDITSRPTLRLVAKDDSDSSQVDTSAPENDPPPVEVGGPADETPTKH